MTDLNAEYQQARSEEAAALGRLHIAKDDLKAGRITEEECRTAEAQLTDARARTFKLFSQLQDAGLNASGPATPTTPVVPYRRAARIGAGIGFVLLVATAFLIARQQGVL